VAGGQGGLNKFANPIEQIIPILIKVFRHIESKRVFIGNRVQN